MVVPLVPLVVLLLLAVVAWGIYRAVRPPLRTARVVAVDRATGAAFPSGSSWPPQVPGYVSERYGLSGRPDELRRTAKGQIIPVEIKSGHPPPGGSAYPSHEIQVLAYCLILEDHGQPPPYGLLVYGDGREVVVPWTSEARRRVLEMLSAIRQPYSGARTPSFPKCRRCPYREGCDGAQSVGVGVR